MKKLLNILTLTGALAILVAATPAFAQVAGPPDSGSDQFVAVGSNMGGIKEVARNPRLTETHVGMPGIYDPEPGPFAAGSEMMPSRGSAIVHPSGGTFVSPEQRADREIRQLIRKLG